MTNETYFEIYKKIFNDNYKVIKAQCMKGQLTRALETYGLEIGCYFSYNEKINYHSLLCNVYSGVLRTKQAMDEKNSKTNAPCDCADVLKEIVDKIFKEYNFDVSFIDDDFCFIYPNKYLYNVLKNIENSFSVIPDWFYYPLKQNGCFPLDKYDKDADYYKGAYALELYLHMKQVFYNYFDFYEIPYDIDKVNYIDLGEILLRLTPKLTARYKPYTFEELIKKDYLFEKYNFERDDVSQILSIIREEGTFRGKEEKSNKVYFRFLDKTLRDNDVDFKLLKEDLDNLSIKGNYLIAFNPDVNYKELSFKIYFLLNKYNLNSARNDMKSYIQYNTPFDKNDRELFNSIREKLKEKEIIPKD